MKKVLSVLAASAFVLTAGVALAGGPGKKMADDSCPEPCQQQIDDLQSSQAQQNEQLGAHGTQLENHEGRITSLEKAWDDNWYFRLGAGAAWLSADANIGGNQVDTDLDTGYLGQIAVGREFSMFNASGRFRAELEFAYQSSDAGDDNVGPLATFIEGNTRDLSADLYTFMVNGFYEQPVADAFSVYAMVGLGVAHATVDGERFVATGVWDDLDEDGSTAFAYKAGLGVTYNFTDEIAGDLGYEYLGVADTGAFNDIGSSNVVASVRFKF